MLHSRLSYISDLLGVPAKAINPSEYATWRLQKKGVRASRLISKGDVISSSSVSFISPPLGISSDQFAGQSLVASEDISPGDVISFDNVQKLSMIVRSYSSDILLLPSLPDVS